MPENVYDVVVIGSGIAGLTATRRLLQQSPELSVANIEAETFGGLVLNVNELDGAIAGSGIDLASGIMMESTDLGAVMLSERVTALAKRSDGWTVTTGEGEHTARALIVASGASIKRLGIPGEDRLDGRGISRCADCDGPMFAGKDVVVAGGGDSAAQEAHVLAALCRSVRVVNKAAQWTAKPHLIEALEACGNVSVDHNSEITEVRGDQTVDGVRIRDLASGSEAAAICAGLFPFIGLAPNVDFLPANIARDAAGFIRTDRALKAADRLFAAGAVRSGCGGMLEDAIADATLAADQVLAALAG